MRSAAAQAAEATAAADPIEQVRQVEARRYDAMARNDLAALGDLLADDLTYTHSQGVVNTKAQMLASLESGALRYRSVTTDDVQIRVYGDAAVVTGAAVLAVTAGGHDVSVPVRFIAVYARQDGRWRLEVLAVDPAGGGGSWSRAPVRCPASSSREKAQSAKGRPRACLIALARRAPSRSSARRAAGKTLKRIPVVRRHTTYRRPRLRRIRVSNFSSGSDSNSNGSKTTVGELGAKRNNQPRSLSTKANGSTSDRFALVIKNTESVRSPVMSAMAIDISEDRNCPRKSSSATSSCGTRWFFSAAWLRTFSMSL